MLSGTEISAAYGGLKTAFDVLQGLNAAAKEASINEVKVQLGRHILDAQAALTAAGAAQADAAERIRQLEQEIARLRDWAAEKQRYELKRYNPGSLAYALKPSMAGSEPPHRLCANCYEQGRKSILQATHAARRRYQVHNCPSCKSEFEMGSETTQPETNDFYDAPDPEAGGASSWKTV